MKNILMKTGLIAAMAATFCGPASAEWTKTYVVEWYEPAMYYGAKTGVIDPGTDCPKGTNAEPNWVQELIDAGYTREEAEWLRNPANPSRNPGSGQPQMAFRGKDRANVYVDPTSTPESGKFFPVTGTIAEGFNLDGNSKTGFTSPTGEKGIDNKFYEAVGCWKTYRGQPRLSSGAMTFNDQMREGSWTVVIVVSGKGADPMNDSKVDVGFYMSGDKLVKGGSGEIARDYTFRIKPDAKFEATFKAKTSKGVIVSTTPTEEIWLRDPSYARELQVLRASIRLEMKPDGSLKGHLGGYRPWEQVYKGWVGARGPVIESLTWVRLPDVYYALRRNADYSPTGPRGEKTHISFAMRIDALPAFVVTPDASKDVVAIASYKAQAPVVDDARALANVRIVNGIVVDRNSDFQPGPFAKILPPAAASTAAAK